MSRPAIVRACSSCGGPISRTSASGRCRECCYGRGAYLGGSRNSAEPTDADGLDGAPYFNSRESSTALLRALRSYAEKYQPDAAWLRKKPVEKPTSFLGDVARQGA